MGGPSPADIPLSNINLTPRRVMDQVVDVWVSDTHAAALRADGSLWTWGMDFMGWGQNADPNAGLRPELIMGGILVP